MAESDVVYFIDHGVRVREEKSTTTDMPSTVVKTLDITEQMRYSTLNDGRASFFKPYAF